MEWGAGRFAMGEGSKVPEIAGAPPGFPALSRHRVMSELAFLQETLRATARRRRFDRALGGLWNGLLAGAVCWLVVTVLYKVAPLPSDLAENGWYVTLAGSGIGLLMGGWRRVPLAAAARWVEARQALNQRLSTALEIAPEAASSPWSRLVLADAARAIRGLHLGRLLPLRLPASARWTPAVLLAVVGLGFVPEYRSAAHLQRRKDATVIRETGRRVAELVRRETEKREAGQEPVRDALEAAAMSGERLSQVKLTKAEALKDLANAAARLQQESQQLAATPALRKLQQAARPPRGSSANPGNSAFQKQLEKLQQSLPNASPDALEKLAKQLQQAQQMAAGMQGNPESPAASEAMSRALDQLARSAAALGLDARGLERALEAMKNLDFDRVLQGLQMAGTDLDKMRDLASKLAEMQKSMQELGKDLAEQLDRGQAEAAARTLDKMVEQLKTSGLNPGEMEKLMAEVGKALQPAKEYGEVARLLGEAARQLQESQGGDASRNLARAAEELRRLARESQDMEQMADVLSALQEAQVAIASGRSWKPGTCKGGNCKGCLAGTCRGVRAGPGGRPGRGVGTWADENGWLYFPEISERWDNSGLHRPDMAARGHTDRPIGEPENLAPTKLQGRFTPGPMPSITLRGVSIKGESTVPYQQAVETAQSDARSALNQDQVPRAYRGAVKGYFDDLQ